MSFFVPLQIAWHLKAVTCIDLTTLSGDDTFTNVQRLCYKAKHPIRPDLLEAVGMNDKGKGDSLGVHFYFRAELTEKNVGLLI